MGEPNWLFLALLQVVGEIIITDFTTATSNDCVRVLTFAKQIHDAFKNEMNVIDTV